MRRQNVLAFILAASLACAGLPVTGFAADKKEAEATAAQEDRAEDAADGQVVETREDKAEDSAAADEASGDEAEAGGGADQASDDGGSEDASDGGGSEASDEEGESFLDQGGESVPANAAPAPADGSNIIADEFGSDPRDADQKANAGITIVTEPVNAAVTAQAPQPVVQNAVAETPSTDEYVVMNIPYDVFYRTILGVPNVQIDAVTSATPVEAAWFWDGTEKQNAPVAYGVRASLWGDSAGEDGTGHAAEEAASTAGEGAGSAAAGTGATAAEDQMDAEESLTLKGVRFPVMISAEDREKLASIKDSSADYYVYDTRLETVPAVYAVVTAVREGAAATSPASEESSAAASSAAGHAAAGNENGGEGATSPAAGGAIPPKPSFGPVIVDKERQKELSRLDGSTAGADVKLAVDTKKDHGQYYLTIENDQGLLSQADPGTFQVYGAVLTDKNGREYALYHLLNLYYKDFNQLAFNTTQDTTKKGQDSWKKYKSYFAPLEGSRVARLEYYTSLGLYTFRFSQIKAAAATAGGTSSAGAAGTSGVAAGAEGAAAGASGRGSNANGAQTGSGAASGADTGTGGTQDSAGTVRVAAANGSEAGTPVTGAAAGTGDTQDSAGTVRVAAANGTEAGTPVTDAAAGTGTGATGTGTAAAGTGTGASATGTAANGSETGRRAPHTGDGNLGRIAAYAALLIASMAAITLLVVKKRAKKD